MATVSKASPATMLNPSETQKSCSGYELCREERIKENRERMQKLGILDLSLKLKSFNNTSATPRNRNTSSIRKTPHRITPLPPSGPARRSSRLQNSTPVSYAENPLSKKDASLKSKNWCLEEGSRPEIYTEEHEKLLGGTNMTWTLFVDGYGKDGKRIYDPVRGKTCHQCRQKTLGQRTHCSQCNMVQGQFCGDCLYMRYGENVLEANQNPDWLCPVCRGICNCSLCRNAKGWAPTGMLYKKVANLGFKSVAHYLIQTQRSTDNVEEDSGTKVPVSAKRSLPFSDKPATSTEESPDQNESEDNSTIEDAKGTTVSNVNSVDQEGLKKTENDLDSDNNSGIITTDMCGDVSENKGKKEDIALESSQGSKKRARKVVVTEAASDSIAGRLRQRREKGCEVAKVELVDLSSIQVDGIAGRPRKRSKCT